MPIHHRLLGSLLLLLLLNLRQGGADLARLLLRFRRLAVGGGGRGLRLSCSGPRRLKESKVAGARAQG